MKKRGQIALEFLMVVGTAFMVMALFLLASGGEISDIMDSRSQILLKDVVFRTQNEINLAIEALPGYERRFTNPDELVGQPYTINNSGTELLGVTTGFEFLLIVPQVVGSAKSGKNVIRNVNGVVCLNAGCATFDTTPPNVVSVSPVNGSAGIEIDTIITVEFDESMDEATLAGAFTLSATAGTVTYNDTFFIATFTPSSQLDPNTTYTATVSTAARDLAGNALNNSHSWVFYTGADTENPGTITGLGETDTTQTTILWNWTNPSDSDYSHAEVWINDSFIVNTTNQSYNATGLTADSIYEIGIRTTDVNGNTNSTWVNDTANTNSSVSFVVVNLWELVADLPAPVDFTSGLNSTSDTFGLGSGDDGWDNSTHTYDNGVTYYDNPSITDIVQFDTSGGRLEITLGGYGSPVPTGPAYNDPISAAFGVEFTISPAVQALIDAGATALLEFDWESEDTTGIEHAFEAVWIKARLSNSSGAFYLGTDLDGDSTPADDDDIDAITDSTNEIYYALQPVGADATGHFTLNASTYFTASGNYYLELGGKLSDWSAADEIWYARFDNINLTIT